MINQRQTGGGVDGPRIHGGKPNGVDIGYARKLGSDGNPKQNNKKHPVLFTKLSSLILAMSVVVYLISFTLPAPGSHGGTVHNKRQRDVTFEPPISRKPKLTTSANQPKKKPEHAKGKDDGGNVTLSRSDGDSRIKNRDGVRTGRGVGGRLHPPRIVGLKNSDPPRMLDHVKSFRAKDIPRVSNRVREAIPSVGHRVQSDWYDLNGLQLLDNPDPDECEPMHDWQVGSFQNCNDFHELDWFRFSMINKGQSRIAFSLSQRLDGVKSKYVYKTMKYSNDIDTWQIEQQRKDAVVMERTTGSKYLPAIHGYCSLAVMMDFMPEGNMHEYIKGSRLAGGSSLAPVDRLRIAIHIAGSVAELHGIDDNEIPPFFHNDLCCHQYLFSDGVFKLNDFNHARPILVNKKTREECPRERVHMEMWKARSLEEWQWELDHPHFTPFMPDKLDIWMMGNIMYIILTDLYLFEKPRNLTSPESGAQICEGKRSPYPKHVAESVDPSIVAVKRALDMCWTQDWRKRPKAREVLDHLMEHLRQITGEAHPDVRVKLPKRDPKQRSTETDYNKYND